MCLFSTLELLWHRPQIGGLISEVDNPLVNITIINLIRFSKDDTVCPLDELI